MCLTGIFYGTVFNLVVVEGYLLRTYDNDGNSSISLVIVQSH